MRGIFVTGTDTGVGKTIVAATIARLLHRRGIRTAVMKPVTSGCREESGKLVSEDAELLRWAVGKDLVDGNSAPYLLRAPLAPSVAAEREGVRIDFAHIAACFARLGENSDFIVVEGAGGLMVPLAGGFLVADLARHLELPILVVARPNLGTINHTFLTTFAAGHLGLATAGIIINNYPAIPDAAEEYAPHLMDSLCGAPLIGVFPRQDAEDLHLVVDRLVVRLEQEPSTEMMLRRIGAPV